MRCRMEKCNILSFFSSLILVHLIFKEISTTSTNKLEQYQLQKIAHAIRLDHKLRLDRNRMRLIA